MKNGILHVDSLIALEASLAREHSEIILQAEQKGEQDGRRNLPAVAGEGIPPFEKQLLSKYQTFAEHVAQEVRQQLHDIHDRQLLTAKEAFEHCTEAEVQRQIQQAALTRDRHLQEAESNHLDALKELENEPAYEHAKRAIQQAVTRLRIVADRIGRYELHRKVRPGWGYTVMSLIGFSELWVNQQAFYVFKGDKIDTLLLALSMVVLMPIAAHVTGGWLRQGGERRAYYGMATVLSTVITVLCYYTAHIRSDSPQFNLITIFFFVLSTALFLSGVAISFLAHDPSPSFAAAYQTLRQTRRRYARTLLHYEAAKRAEISRYQQKKEHIQNEFTLAEAKALGQKQALSETIHHATSAYNQVLRMGQGLEKTMQHRSHEVIHHYRDANLTFRTNHAQPNCWQEPLPGLALSLNQLSEIV